MKLFQIKEETAFFGVIMTKFDPKNSDFLIILQDRNTFFNVRLENYIKTIPAGTPIYGRGLKYPNDEKLDLMIDLNQFSHRVIGFSSQFIQKNSEVKSSDDFTHPDVSDGKPIFGFEDFSQLDYKNLRETYNLFRVISTELNAENLKKIGSGHVPKYIYGHAIEELFEIFKVNKS